MRDRLVHLQTISEEQEDSDDPYLHGPEYDVDNAEIPQQAVVYDSSTVMDDLLNEAHAMRKEISLLELEVQRLVQHNERVSTTTRQLTIIKQDSNSISKRIHQRGEALHARLKALGERSKELEESEGPNAAVARIARTQYNTISLAFHATMAEYNQVEEKQKTVCRERIQRQASILGKEMSTEQMDTLVEKGGEGWGELSQSLQTEGKSSRWALCEIKGRHRELVELEARLKEVRDLFLEMDMLVEEQGVMMDDIEFNVSATHDYLQRVNVEIKTALRYKRRNPFTQCCACLPWCQRDP